MPGGTANHSRIANKIGTLLTNELEDNNERNYFIFNSDMKIWIPSLNHALYPDALVICDEIDFLEGRKDIILNPLLIVEVLSPSTERYDYGNKFMEYKTLPSFKEYLIIRQDAPIVESFFKTQDRTWEETQAFGLEDKITLRSVGLTISLADIYKKIVFG